MNTPTPRTDEICSACGLPMHPDDPKRYCGWHTTHQHSRCIDLLRAELAAAQKDAERYRWLAADGDRARKVITEYSGHQVQDFIDNAIDAARKDVDRG